MVRQCNSFGALGENHISTRGQAMRDIALLLMAPSTWKCFDILAEGVPQGPLKHACFTDFTKGHDRRASLQAPADETSAGGKPFPGSRGRANDRHHERVPSMPNEGLGFN